MSYEVINEELKIAKCSITDLTIGQVHNFLESWGDDSKIGTLTMFYDREKELLVLNEDNDMYETYLHNILFFNITQYKTLRIYTMQSVVYHPLFYFPKILFNSSIFSFASGLSLSICSNILAIFS